MDEELRTVAENMLGLGCGALAHANWHAAHMSFENRYWPEMSIIQAAHAAEILIKARICEEHPLLIFETLPKMAHDSSAKLSLEAISERGRTIKFLDLPERLWATTGIRLADRALFDRFGKVRNRIAHFTRKSEEDYNDLALQFIYGVIDPFINECWDMFAVDIDEDPETPIDLVEALVRRNIPFLVSPFVIDSFDSFHIAWEKVDNDYRNLMDARFDAARKAKGG